MICDSLIVYFMFSVTYSPDLIKLPGRARFFIDTARAPSTNSLYTTAFRSYKGLCFDLGIQNLFPLDEKILILWATFLSKSVDISTIRKYISGLHGIHKDLGYFACTQNFYFLEKTLKGIARYQRTSRKSSPDLRQPLTSEILHLMLKIVSFDNKDSIMLWSAILLIKFALLRAGEVLPTSYNPKNILLWSDLRFGSEKDIPYVDVYLYQTKTNKSSKPQKVRVACSNSKLCPVHKILKLFTIVKENTTENSPVFIFSDNTFVTPQVLTKYMRFLLKSIHPNPNLFSAHSLRIGQATDMSKVGISDSTIQNFGRWKSGVFKRYTRLQNEQIFDVSRKTC